MKDNEIIKALECCGNIVDSTCKNCVYHETYNDSCVVRLMCDVLDLINRQKAEIERLQKHKKEYGFCNLLGNVLVYSKNLKDYNDMRKGLKAEAIKEFAEKVKEATFHYYDSDIDNLVKEMTKNITKIEHNSLCETETYKGGD